MGVIPVWQRSKDDYELRQHIKNKFEEHQEETSFEDELKNYSDEGLQNLEASLSREMHSYSKTDPQHQILFEKYVVVCRELDRRDLTDDIPF